ncbi:hypothetical protein PsYK624_162660 [Phanerochaete sordida]|uniref:Uncharacterized protein n=1 Tax=Phanerochaete sordida TaxID=48140 RepID=A0A9P3LLQ4_9APHY|nr:hypothetical protein PsYK624_162660 [Phanerochaete sordida]
MTLVKISISPRYPPPPPLHKRQQQESPPGYPTGCPAAGCSITWCSGGGETRSAAHGAGAARKARDGSNELYKLERTSEQQTLEDESGKTHIGGWKAGKGAKWRGKTCLQ